MVWLKDCRILDMVLLSISISRWVLITYQYTSPKLWAMCMLVFLTDANGVTYVRQDWSPSTQIAD